MVKINSNNKSDPTDPLVDDSMPGSPRVKPSDDARTLSQRAHQQSDVDGSDRSQHHTIGPSRGQAASGSEFAQEKHVRQWDTQFTNINANILYSNAYQIIRGVCFWWFRGVITSSGAVSGTVQMSLPVSALMDNDWAIGSGYANDNSDTTNRTLIVARVATSELINLFYTGGSVNGSNPFTWDTGDSFILQGQYPVAREAGG